MMLSNNLVIAATSVTCLLVFTLLYISLFSAGIQLFTGKDFNEKHLVSDPPKFLLRRLVRGKYRVQLDKTGLSCPPDLHSEVCISNKPVAIQNSTVNIYLSSDARKEDEAAPRTVTPVQILRKVMNFTACNVNYSAPAVVFSSGGFKGNMFHELNDIIIPLFITCRHFQSEVHIVITDFKPRWVRKYSRILSGLSRYEIINASNNVSVIHCFDGVVVGLKYHGILALNYTEIPGGYSMFEFKEFLRGTYNLKNKYVSSIRKSILILTAQNETRIVLNEGEIVDMMEEQEFQVLVARPEEMSDLDKFARVVNSCSVMVGVYGAGLTSAVFLPHGAAVVQIVPVAMDWEAENYYGEPVKRMGLHYVKYNIGAEEIVVQKNNGSQTVVGRMSVSPESDSATKAAPSDAQNMKINLSKLMEAIVEAKNLLRSSTL